jgi:hypothetical protein
VTTLDLEAQPADTERVRLRGFVESAFATRIVTP